MTDNEIIKALECCMVGGVCEDCPYCTNEQYTCGAHLDKDILDLINRQQAEIENMNNLVIYNATCATKLQLKLVEAKAEAIKEFVARLIIVNETTAKYCEANEKVVRVTDIEDLVKEMVGDAE